MNEGIAGPAALGLVTLVVFALLAFWNNGRRQRDQTEIEREQLLVIEREQRLLAETLAHAFLALTSQTDQTKVLDEILNQVQHVVPYDAANIVLIEDEVLHLVRWQGYKPADSENLLSYLRQPLSGFPLDAEVVQSRQTLVIADVKHDPRWIATTTSSWIRSFMAAPISLHDRVIGLLRLDSSTPHRFSPADIARLEPLTNAAAIALENARLYGQLQKELMERTQAEQKAHELNRRLLTMQYTGATVASSLDLEYILDTLTVEIVQLFDVEGCAVYEWNQVSDTITTLVRFELNGLKQSTQLNRQHRLADFPLAKSVLTQKRAQQVTLSQPDSDPAELAYMKANQLKVILLLPMETRGDVMGLLEITESRVERVFTLDEFALMQQLANQAAGAIKNARLYAEINRYLKGQTALREAITIISSTLDLDTVLNHIVEQMGQVADATSAYICSYEAQSMTSRVLAEYFGPEAVIQEKISDLGATYPLPRDFTRDFQSLLGGHPEVVHLDGAEMEKSNTNHMRQFGAQTILNIPLRVRSQTVAFAELWESRQKRHFTKEELALFQSIAQQAAITLENAYLYDRASKEVAERRKVEKELRESETKFRILAETTAAAIFIYQQNRNRYVNPAAVAITGYTVAELLEMDFWEVIHPDFRQLVKERGSARLRGEAISPRYELKILTKKAEERWLDVTLGLIRYEGDVAVLGTAFDITNRKQAEESVRKSEANLKAIFENSRQAFILIDKDNRIQAFNKVADYGTKLTLGQELKEGRPIYQYIALSEQNEFRKNFEQALQGQSVSEERKFLINDTDMWLEFNYNPVIADNGQVAGVCFSTFDITIRKNLIETLAENEDRLLAEIQSILAVTRALVTETNLNSLLEFIMLQAKYLTQADGAAVLLLNEDSQQLEAAILDKNHQELEVNTLPESRIRIKSNLQLPLKGSLAERAIASRTIQISHKVEDDEWTAFIWPILDAKPVHTLVCTPLTIQRKDLGVLLIWSHREHFFTHHDNLMMALFADQAALALNNAYLHALNRQLTIVQERQRLARDLHDSVTQTLYSIGMGAETALGLIDRNKKEDIRRPVLHIHQLAQIALKELREQVHHLHPTAFADTTLIELLETHCSMLREQHALEVELAIDPTIEFSIYQRENLFYLAKEALWNVVKHAQGAGVHISITQAAGLATLSIADNGPGFATSTSADMEIFGLRSMRERAALLGASMAVDSRPDRGTRITVKIPLTK